MCFVLREQLKTVDFDRLANGIPTNCEFDTAKPMWLNRGRLG
jgi:hypothetical protein